MAARYSVNGVTVIDDLGQIPWSLIKNHPLVSLVTDVAAAVTNCATGGTVSASITVVTSTTYKLNVTVS